MDCLRPVQWRGLSSVSRSAKLQMLKNGSVVISGIAVGRKAFIVFFPFISGYSGFFLTLLLYRISPLNGMEISRIDMRI